MPFAPATGIGSTADWADHSNSVCRRHSSTISSPDICSLFSAVVVIGLGADNSAWNIWGSPLIRSEVAPMLLQLRNDAQRNRSQFVLFGPAYASARTVHYMSRKRETASA